MPPTPTPKPTPAPGKSRFKRGARLAPRHKLLATPAFKAKIAAPPQAALVPDQLDMWGNDSYGDCVSAEEAFGKACYQPEIFIPGSNVIEWADAHGFLNGADLPEVMDAMRGDGMKVGGQRYDDGGYAGVDYSDESVLKSALALGPVKIAIDANALPGGAGNNQGWYATGGGNYPNTDHCVALCAYGPAKWLYEQLGVPLPAALKPDQQGYLLYTWSTIGFVDHAWIMGTTQEAYLRTPTTVGVPPLPGPTPPDPGPGPGPGPGPEPEGNHLHLTTDLPAGYYPIGGNCPAGTASAVTIEYQDGTCQKIPPDPAAKK